MLEIITYFTKTAKAVASRVNLMTRPWSRLVRENGLLNNGDDLLFIRSCIIKKKKKDLQPLNFART